MFLKFTFGVFCFRIYKKTNKKILPNFWPTFWSQTFSTFVGILTVRTKPLEASLTKHTHGMSVSHKGNFIFRFLFFNFEIVVCIWIPSVHKTVDHENIVWSQRKVLELILFCLNFAEAYEVMSIFTKTVEKNVI